MLATGDASGRVALWNLPDGGLEREIKADATIVNAVAFSNDSRVVAAGGSEGVVRLWQVRSPSPPVEIVPMPGLVSAVTFTPNQGRLVVATLGKGEAEISIWDWEEKKKVSVFPGAAAVRAVAVSPDDRFMAVGEYHGAIRLHVLPAESGASEISVTALPESDNMSHVDIWDLRTGRLEVVLDAELGSRALAFSQDGTTLACGGDRGVMLFKFAGTAMTEHGRIDSATQVDAVAFGTGSQIVLARERQRIQKISGDPTFIGMTMIAKEGVHSTIASMPKTDPSVTGGARLEVWDLRVQESAEQQLLSQAIAKFFGGKQAEARRDLDSLIAAYPTFAEALRLKAVWTTDRGVAENLLNAAIKADPGCVACYRTLGDIQYANDKLADAAMNYATVLKLNPDYSLVEERLAFALLRGLTDLRPGDARRLEAAEKVALQAISLRPTVAKFYSNLAVIYAFQDDHAKAIRTLEQALALDPGEARAYYNLGQELRAVGDKKKAILAFRRYVFLGEKGQEDRVKRAESFIRDLSEEDKKK
jgi:Flp pilus assembly protein TadD